jgi:hypothetical protein
MSNTLTSGTTSGLVIDYENETEFVLGGATISYSVVEGSVAGLVLESGAVANFVTLYPSQNAIEVDSGAVANNTLLEDEELIYGTDDNATVIGAGFQYIYAGGVANNTTIGGNSAGSDGLQYIETGGTADNNIVLEGGHQYFEGGTAQNTTVFSGGLVYNGDGTISFLTIDGGTAIVGEEGTLGGSIDFAGTSSVLEVESTANILSGSTITGFGPTDQIDLFGVSYSSAGTVTLGANNTLTVVENAETYILSLDPVQTFNGTFSIGAITINRTASTEITYSTACFAAGTRIRKPSGALAPVEGLRPGEALQLYSGKAAAIAWVGHRNIDLSRHPRQETVQPILISAGALGAGIPLRDLVVSPDHALYLDGHLIPSKALRNGFSIRQLNRRCVTYYHIELAEHAVLVAEGVPAESYLETGNRAAFANGGPAVVLHPNFAQTIRERKSCAPFVESGPVVEAVRRRILDRAGIETTEDPRLRIRYQDGAAIISSRAAIPGEIFADPRDRRRLGVKIARLEIGGVAIAVDHPALVEGWHDMEADGRWTNGRAVVPKSMVGGGKVRVVLAATLRYPVARQRRAG